MTNPYRRKNLPEVRALIADLTSIIKLSRDVSTRFSTYSIPTRELRKKLKNAQIWEIRLEKELENVS